MKKVVTTKRAAVDDGKGERGCRAHSPCRDIAFLSPGINRINIPVQITVKGHGRVPRENHA